MRKPSIKTTLLLAGVLGLGLSGRAAAGTLQQDLVVHLPFDGSIEDSTGHTTPSAVGSPTVDTKGKIGSGALKFSSYAGSAIPEGAEQFNYVTLPVDGSNIDDPLVFGDATDFSISFWVNFNTWGGDPSFIANKNWGSGGNTGWVIATDNDGRVQWNYRESGNGAPRRDYDGPGHTVDGGSWHHVVVTFQRNAKATTYIDAVLQNSSTLGFTDADGNWIPGGIIESGLPINIGQDGTGTYTDGQITDGLIDDVGIWRRVLSSSEVGRIFKSGNEGVNLANIADPTAVSVTSSFPVDGASNADPAAAFGATIEDAGTSLKVSSVKLSLDNVAVSPVVTETAAGKYTVSYTPAGLLASGSTHVYKLQFTDNEVPANAKSLTSTFAVGRYTDYKLGSPVWLETFDGTAENPLAEGSLPEGWLVDNYSDTKNDVDDLADKNSSTYKNWAVITGARMTGLFGDDRGGIRPLQVLNGKVLTSLVDGQLAYGNSDGRGGNVYQILTSPDVNLTGKGNIYLAFNSVYAQNQDSMGSVEYSIDGGATWQPVVYFINGKPSNTDLRFTEAGFIDGALTLSEPHGDAAQYTDPNTGNPGAGKYGSYIGVTEDRWPELGPFISGRIDDDEVESKRLEVYRLPLADNQATVRLRFAHSGTDSWYFGIDNVGLYSAVLPAPKLSLSSTATSLTVSVENLGVLQTSASLNGPWVDITAVDSSFTAPITAEQAYYRVVRP